MSENVCEKPKTDTRHRGWIFTINNPVQTETELFEYLKGLYNIRYFVFAKEKGDKSEGVHYQGYIEFSEPKYFSKMKNDFSEPYVKPSAHIQMRKGNKKQASDYAKKTGKYTDKKHTQIGEPIEYGALPGESGERTDLENIVLMINDGRSLAEIKAAYPSQYLRYHKNIEHLFHQYMADKYCEIDRNVKVVYIWGPPRIGKSRSIDKLHGRREYYRVPKYKHPFDKYNYQPVLVLDEYDSQIDITYMNNLLDSLPCQLECRYEDKWAAWDTVYIISNLSFERQYPNEKPEKREAFKSRISEFINFTGDKQKGAAVRQYESNTNTARVATLRPLSEAEQEELGF